MGPFLFYVILLATSILVSGSSADDFKRLTRAEFENLKQTCGKSFVSNHPRGSVQRIANGGSVKQGEFPWGVLFVYTKVSSTNYFGPPAKAIAFGYCSGSIISKYHIITAAHCVLENNVYGSSLSIDIKNSYVVNGLPCGHRLMINFQGMRIPVPITSTSCDGRGYKEPRLLRIKRVLVPQSSLDTIPAQERIFWEGAILDIAVLELENPISDTDDEFLPICVPSNTTSMPQMCTAYGFGVTENGIIVDKLHKYPVDAYKSSSKKICGSKWSYKKRCAETVTFDMDSDAGSMCEGDSGGALSGFVDGKEYLFGVLSTSYAKYCPKTEAPQFSWFPISSQNAFTVTKVSSYSDFLCFYTGVCPLGYDVYSDKNYVQDPEPAFLYSKKGHFLLPARKGMAE